MGHDVKKGDVFVESWGYDQTNVDYYLVTRATEMSVYLVKCEATTVTAPRTVGGATAESGRSQTRLMPDIDKPQPFTSGERTRIGKANHRGEVIKRVQTGYEGRPCINLTTYSYGRLWDGESSHFDTIAAGYPGH